MVVSVHNVTATNSHNTVLHSIASVVCFVHVIHPMTSFLFSVTDISDVLMIDHFPTTATQVATSTIVITVNYNARDTSTEAVCNITIKLLLTTTERLCAKRCVHA